VPEEVHVANILMVEDDPADVLLTKKALERSRIKVNLTVKEGAEEALHHLREASPRPDLVLLDLNLPGMSGQEFLRELRSDPAIKAMPVVVLTTSQVGTDIMESYELGANCFVSKPVGLDAFYEIIAKLEDFWFTVVRLPRD